MEKKINKEMGANTAKNPAMPWPGTLRKGAGCHPVSSRNTTGLNFFRNSMGVTPV